MPRFRKKPIEVEAEQWFPGKEVPGVTLKPTEIHYSSNRTLYYVTRSGDRPDCWLSVATKPGEVSPEDAAKAGMFRQIGQFKTDDGRVYSRDRYPFTFNKVSGKEIVEPISEDTDLFLDYASTCEFLREPKPTAYVTTIQGQRVEIGPGEWVITESDGVHHYPCKPDEFERIYEPVEL